MARSKVELFEQIRRDRRIERLSIRELAQRVGLENSSLQLNMRSGTH